MNNIYEVTMSVDSRRYLGQRENFSMIVIAPAAAAALKAARTYWEDDLEDYMGVSFMVSQLGRALETQAPRVILTQDIQECDPYEY